jgi:exodeoxyribonuclease (lambda-induced)
MKVWEVIQGSEAWAEARRGKATASRFSSFITDKKAEFSETGAKSYACELLAEKIVLPHYWIDGDKATRAMQHGTNTEQEARNYFEFITGKTATNVGFITTEDEFWGASPDSLVDPDSGLELKCPLHKTQVKYLLNADELTNEYRAQCHGAMLITKRKHWHLMSYAVGLPPVLIEFVVDDYTLKLAEAMERFRNTYNAMAERLGAMGDPVAAVREPFVSPF